MSVQMHKMEKKLKDLQRRYPDNEYKIVEHTIKKKVLVSIERTRGTGRRPHKVSMKRHG